MRPTFTDWHALSLHCRSHHQLVTPWPWQQVVKPKAKQSKMHNWQLTTDNGQVTTRDKNQSKQTLPSVTLDKFLTISHNQARKRKNSQNTCTEPFTLFLFLSLSRLCWHFFMYLPLSFTVVFCSVSSFFPFRHFASNVSHFWPYGERKEWNWVGIKRYMRITNNNHALH